MVLWSVDKIAGIFRSILMSLWATVSRTIKRFNQRNKLETKAWFYFFRVFTNDQKLLIIWTIKKNPPKSHDLRPEKRSWHCRFYINYYSIFKNQKPAKEKHRYKKCTVLTKFLAKYLFCSRQEMVEIWGMKLLHLPQWFQRFPL